MSWDTLLPYVASLGNTTFALWLGQATWRIAGLLTIHLFGLTLLLGTVLLSSLRLLGLFQGHRPPREVRNELSRAFVLGLGLMLASGLLIFTGGAEAYYVGYWFRLKMVLLAIALTFQFTVLRVVTFAEDGRFGPAVRKLVGGVALVLWFSVACAGRTCSQSARNPG